MLGLVLVAGGLVAAWFSGNGTLDRLFAQLQAMQNHPPMWLQVPMVMGEYLLTPTVALLAISWVIMRVSPGVGDSLSAVAIAHNLKCIGSIRWSL
jgi:cellulose synthase (UDP-forming)